MTDPLDTQLEQHARESLKIAYLDRLIEEDKLNADNFVLATIKVVEMVDNLVSIQEGNKITFYGIDGKPGDPNNIAAVLVVSEDDLE